MSRKRQTRIDWSVLAETVPLVDFYCSDHPEVYLIPPEYYHQVVDEMGDRIGIMQMPMPFSSNNFYADIEREGGVFNALYCNPRFHRLGGINQLGYLVPPRPKDKLDFSKVFYTVPNFPHTRWGHSFLTGILAELVLARNGFPKSQRDPFVLAAACHDIAMPAGGDSIMRLDPARLSEEVNFRWVLEQDGVAEKWAREFGFNLDQAAQWVVNGGPYGILLDILDKMAYTAHDAYYVTCVSDVRARRLCQEHPLIMDIWQDVRFDGEKVWFESADGLYFFLLLRAYLSSDVYFNPRCRALDHVLYNQVRQYYHPNLRDKLLTWSDNDLQEWLWEMGEPGGMLESPDRLEWRKFNTEKEARAYGRWIKNFSHVDRVKPFKTGLDWLVRSGCALVQLQHVLSRRRIALLEYLSRRHAGWYTYYFKE